MYSKGRKLGMNIAGKLKKKLGDSDVKEQQGMPLHDVSSESAVGLNMESAGQKLSKSSSMGSINNDSTVSERTIVNQDDIIVLTQGVKSFSDGLARLKTVFGDCSTESKEELRVQTHERLGEVLFILKNILHNYPALQSTELFAASGALISKVKNFDYGGTSTSAAELNFAEAIDQLALAFSSSVSEYLMGDIDSSFTEKDAKTKSCDNLLGSVNEKESEGKEEAPDQEVTMTPEDIDNLLCKLQAGVDIALQRAKAWSKYMKDITSYIEKKAQLETEYSKNLARLALSMKPILTEEGFLPLQSVYCTVLSQDKDYASTCQATQTLLQSSKFVEPLMARRLEHDKMRKNIKDSWSKELKRMQDSVHSLRKAQSLYVTRQQEYEKAKEQAKKMESDMLSQSSSSSALNKVDKRRKMEEEAQHKAAEAETTYKACVAEANCRQQELGRTKTELLARIREQIYQCDQVIKAVTIEYFHLLHTVSTPIPIQYHTLSETTKQYDPGVQYREFVRRLPVSASKQTNTEPFVFESFVSYSAREVDTRKTSTQSTGSASSGAQSQEGSPQPTSPWKDRSRVPPVTAWSQGMVAGSDTDSASGSSKSLESSPNNSPHPTGHRRLVQTGSLDDLDEVNDLDKQRLIQQGLLPIPGSDVGDGLCLVKFQGDRRNTTFGVDFQEQVQHCHSAVPPIVIKCLQEIEKRGITFEGIYRKSGVKSKVEGLCRKFEKDPDSVDLDDEPPHVIANVLKLYLRQLPEPLLTFKLYSAFIRAARETASGNSEKPEIISALSDIITQLPYSNLKTCATLMYHLYRISSYSSINQMTAHNLGIIFGPTLLRPLKWKFACKREGTSSLASLVDMPYQTRAVELLITHVQDVFGPESEYELIPGETPVEQLANDKSSKKQHLAPSPPSPSSPLTDAKSSTERKVQPQEQKADSASSPEKVVEELIKGDQDNTEPKNSVADFVLPGSAHSDKKDSNSPTVTISDGDDTGDTQSDDDLPDIVLPDDSLSPQSQQPPTMFCHQEGRGTITAQHVNNSTTNHSCDRDNLQGKPSPPQQLRLAASEVMSPETARKMMVPTINIIDSSPVGDKSIQTGFIASRDQSKKLNQSWPSQSSKKSHQGKSSSDSGISLKSVGPSIQSFIMSTAKSIFSDGLKQSSSKSTSVTSSNVDSEANSAEEYGQIEKIESSDKKSEVSSSVSRASPMSPLFTQPQECITKTPTPPTFSPQLCRQAARNGKEKPVVAPKPTLESIAASTAKDDTKCFPSPFLSRLTSTTKSSNVSSSPVLTRFTPLKSDEPISKTPVKSRSSPQLMRQAMVSDESNARHSYTSSGAANENQSSVSPRYSFTPQSPRFSPKPLRHAMSVQSSMSTGYGLHKTGPSPTLSRKSLSLTDHSVGKSGRISPRPLSSPLLLRQSSTSPVFRSNQRESDSSQSSSDPLLSSGEHPEFSRSSSQSSSDQHEFALDSLMEGKSEDLTALFKTGMESRNRRSLCSLDKVEDEELKLSMSSSHGKAKEEISKNLKIANDQPIKQPKLPAFDTLKELHCTDKEIKTEDCEEKGEKIDTSKLAHRDASFNTTTTSNGTFKNHSNLKLSPREKFLLGISNNEPPKTVKSVSFDLDPFESKDSDDIEAKEELDNPNVVLKIIEENFAGKGNVEKNVLDEQRPSDMSVVSGYVYEVSPRILSRSQPSIKSKSEQSSYSLSSHSSMSDIDDSSVTSSDVSPELSRSLISLPKSSKSILSSSGFPDFSPILPRQKDTVLKKHDSLPNLPPSSTCPLSGNLSKMTSVTSDTSNAQMPRSVVDDRLGISDPVSVSSANLFSCSSTTATSQPAKCTTFVSSSDVVSCPVDTVATPAGVADARLFTSASATSCHSKSVVQMPESETVPGMTSSSITIDPNCNELLRDQSHKDQLLAQIPSDEESPTPKMTRSLPYTDLHIHTKSIQVTGSLAKIISPLIAQTSSTLHYSEPNISAAMKQKTPLPQSSSVKDVGLVNSQPIQSKIPISPKIKRSGGFVTETPNISSQQSMYILQSTPTEEQLKVHGDVKITQSNTPLSEQSTDASLVSSFREQLNRPPQPAPKPTKASLVSISPESSASQITNQMFAQRPQPIGGEYGSISSQQTETSCFVSEQPVHILEEIRDDVNSSTEQTQSDATNKQEIVPAESTPSPSMVTKTLSKDTKARPARTALQTTKSTVTRDPPKTAKGPSGIVMGKAAIMPGRGNRALSSVGGRKSPAVVGSAASGRKSPAVGNSGVGGRKSPAVSSSTVSTARRSSAGALSSSTCGRKSPSVGLSCPAGGIASTGGRKSVGVSSTAGGRKSPAVSNPQKAMSQGSGSPVSASTRKSSVPSSTSTCSSPKSSVSCSTCGRRKTSVGRTGSEPTQQVTLTSYRRTSVTTPGSEQSQGQRSGSDGQKTSESKDSEAQSGKKKVPEKGHKIIVRSSGTRKERVPYFV